MQYTKHQLEFIQGLRDANKPWKVIEKLYNHKFDDNKTHDALRLALSRQSELVHAGIDEVDITVLRQARSAAKASNKNKKILGIALDSIDLQQDILEGIKDLVSKATFAKVKVAKQPKVTAKTSGCILEVLLSDLHYGKKTNEFNSVVARKRMQKYAASVVKLFQDQKAVGNPAKAIHLALLGDIIESSTMHGAESLKGCEFGNSEQVVHAIESLFEDFFIPMAALNVPIVVNCVAGNHERMEVGKTYNNPGKEYLSWVIYNTLKMLSSQAFPTASFKFNIAEGPVLLHEIFGEYVVYEHYDLTGACTKKALAEMMNKRQTQLGKIISYYRGGHYHEFTTFDRGRIIVNGCLPGNDGYSESLGFDTEPVQVINVYNDNRLGGSYSHTVPVYLGD